MNEKISHVEPASSSGELLSLAEALLAHAKDGLEPANNVPIQLLGRAVNDIAKSSSGSWLGYQANVYYKNFNPPPPGARFSQEWGLKEMFSGNGTKGEWVEYNPDDVKNEIYSRAGNPDLGINHEIANRSELAFNDNRSEILSILTTELAIRSDKYLEALKSEVEALEYIDRGEIIRRMAGSGQLWSRDAIAANQGRWAPPHKKVEAEIAELHNATAIMVELSKIAKKAATHIERKEKPRASSIPFGMEHQLAESIGLTLDFPDQNIRIVESLARSFHRMALQINRRHNNRDPFVINDEYDVQDFMHAVLRGFFEDIRCEEWAPSYAGRASRMDFLLKKEKIVLEIKMASSSLKDAQVGEQLIIDIARYQTNNDCKYLICFVYDPGSNLKNPIGLETDLSKKHGSLEVKVIVVSPS